MSEETSIIVTVAAVIAIMALIWWYVGRTARRVVADLSTFVESQEPARILAEANLA